MFSNWCELIDAEMQRRMLHNQIIQEKRIFLCWKNYAHEAEKYAEDTPKRC